MTGEKPNYKPQSASALLSPASVDAALQNFRPSRARACACSCHAVHVGLGRRSWPFGHFLLPKNCFAQARMRIPYGSVCAFVRLCDTGARMVSTVPTPRFHGSGLFRHDVSRGQNHETEAVDPFRPTVHGFHRPDPGRSDPPDRTLGRPRSHRQPWALCRGYFRGSPRSLRCSYRIRGEFYSVKQHAP